MNKYTIKNNNDRPITVQTPSGTIILPAGQDMPFVVSEALRLAIEERDEARRLAEKLADWAWENAADFRYKAKWEEHPLTKEIDGYSFEPRKHKLPWEGEK